MIKIEDQLAAIGFAKGRPLDCGWRSVRLDPAAVTQRAGAEPPCSRELLRWRDRLRRGSRSSPYRISRA